MPFFKNCHVHEFISIRFDITEKIFLHQKVEEQKTFYETILNNIPVDVAVFNKQHQYLFVNPNAVHSASTREFLIGKDDFDYCKHFNKNIEIIKEVMKEKNKNIISKKNKIKTSTHDVMMIQTSLNNIKTTFTDIKSISLTGDLGYLSSKIYKLNNENIQLITPKRKNKIKKNTENERIKLCSRYKIENCFGLLKQY